MKMKIFKLLTLLVLAAPLVHGYGQCSIAHAAGSGGFPSKPTFAKITIKPNETNGAVKVYQRDGNDLGFVLFGSTGATHPAFTNSVEGISTGDSAYLTSSIYWNGSGWIASEGTAGNGFASMLILNNAGCLVSFQSATGLTGGAAAVPAEVLCIKRDGSMSSSKACASGFTRITPNFCSRGTNSSNYVALVRDTCTAVARPSADTVAVLVRATSRADSANAAGVLRTTQVSGYVDTSCAGTAKVITRAAAYEHTAVASNTELASDQALAVLHLTGTNFYLQFSDDAGNQGDGSYSIEGYFD